jgi:RimJ/RimL family protein N-acetyltransferase
MGADRRALVIVAPDAAPLRFLQGARLYLRPLEDADVSGPYPSWLNDELVCRGNSHHVFPYSLAQASDYVRRAASQEAVVLAIVLNDGQKHIGNIALTRIHPVYRSAEFSILLGDAEEWGKGYAREAAALLIRHGFGALNLHRIACGTFATNAAMRRLALSLGMKEEGIRRQAAYKDGRYVDVLEFGLLREEFERP